MPGEHPLRTGVPRTLRTRPPSGREALLTVDYQNAFGTSELILPATGSLRNASLQPETLIDPERLCVEDNCLCQGFQPLGEAPQSKRKVD